MKKLPWILFLLMAAVAYGQENVNAPQKFALVIGNSNYTNFGTLRNPVNDASDMEETLLSLGFVVDKVLDGSLGQMENASIRLRNRLSEAGNDSIGFFFYAGHGLEFNGVNYLIPADANIPERNFLRERAFSVQIMLDMLNDSRNSLNIIVLDACRDFPAAWSRSLNRGLVMITNPPANHIIMYATGAGMVANDGTGRNGLFTGHLLNNLKQPGMDINEIFRRTMGDVSRASNNEQRPALYTDFAETVYFDSGPIAAQPSPAQPAQEQPLVQATQPVPAQSVQERPATRQEPIGTNQPAKTVDARKNWISGEVLLFPLGVGASYERMLGSKISLGINGYWGTVSIFYDDFRNYGYGIDAFFRVYPWSKTFFLGAILGFYYGSSEFTTHIYDGFSEYTTRTDFSYYGLVVAPEMGWKIDAGSPGGFFLQLAIGMPFVFGKNTDPEQSIVPNSAWVGVGSRWVYFSMGYAF